jgi:hypothetical protein
MTPAPRTPTSTRKVALLSFVLGALCGACFPLLWARYSAAKDYTMPVDDDQNGVIDVEYDYRQGVLTETRHDRNQDGEVDYREGYDNGTIARAVGDDDFDGKPDNWISFSKGRLVRSERDTDRNGVPDVTMDYMFGVVHKGTWRPNDSKAVTKISIAPSAVLIAEYHDKNNDGIVDRITYYDKFGDIEREEVPATRLMMNEVGENAKPQK